MARWRTETKWERGPAPDLWRHTLSRIPTVFGRLVYLASLRDQNTGQYEHHGLEQVYGPEEADQTMRQSHNEVFGEWLCSNLEQQKRDLEEYLSGLDTNTHTVLATWIRLKPYRNFAPTVARDVERQLFLTDLETVLELLKYEYAVAAPELDA